VGGPDCVAAEGAVLTTRWDARLSRPSPLLVYTLDVYCVKTKYLTFPILF